MNATEILAHHDLAHPWSGGLGLRTSQAYDMALQVRTLRMARGEQPRGYKIGFTNRGLWARYGVDAPIWGTVWDTSLHFCDGRAQVSLSCTCEPRIEPECVFGMAHTPPPDASLTQLFEAIEWVAPGFEVVQSHRPGWKFEASDAIADGSLHARLLVGARRRVRDCARDAHDLETQLAHASVVLCKGDMRQEQGTGANVLEGPLHALHYFLHTLRQCPGAPDLQAGDVVTTGTWTDAYAVAAGETWRAQFDAPLSPLEVTFVKGDESP